MEVFLNFMFIAILNAILFFPSIWVCFYLRKRCSRIIGVLLLAVAVAEIVFIATPYFSGINEFTPMIIMGRSAVIWLLNGIGFLIIKLIETIRNRAKKRKQGIAPR